MKAQLPAQLTKVTSRSDRSYKLEFSTRELNGKDAAILLDDLMSEGWLLWSSTGELEDKDVPKEKADTGLLGGKSPSQRLRAVLYILWEQSGKSGQFEDYYRRRIETIIETVKDKLE